MSTEQGRRVVDSQPRTLAPCPLPRALLMCPPTYFDVVDVKNDFMRDNVGQVDAQRACHQWNALKDAVSRLGIDVKVIEPLPGREDMVFTANQAFVGLDNEQRRVALLSRMKYPSRQLEVSAVAARLQRIGYNVQQNLVVAFEGGGDAIWHPGARLAWVASGPRSEPGAAFLVGRVFGAPVIPVRLASSAFYHLDTCFCPVNADVALVHTEGLDVDSLTSIRSMFRVVVEVERDEAAGQLACNALPILGHTVILQAGATQTKKRLERLGICVIELDLSEFTKSGGSAFCMKNWLF